MKKENGWAMLLGYVLFNAFVGFVSVAIYIGEAFDMNHWPHAMWGFNIAVAIITLPLAIAGLFFMLTGES